jgi:hypothetical protein
LLHPFSLFGLLILGVLLIGLTLFSSADSFVVTASVPAKPLTSPAIITFPTDGANIAQSPIDVTGTCPLDSYVDLIRNRSFSGVDYCSADQTFTISTDLSSGINLLQVQDYNVTNQAGPTSSAISVNYEAPPPPPQPVQTSTSPGQLSPDVSYTGSNQPSSTVIPSYDNSGHGPLVLSSQYEYQTYQTGHKYTWKLDLTGGTPPYFVNINWGDGSSSNMVFDTDPIFTASHIYKKAGDHNIIAQAIDAKGVKVLLQLTAVVKLQGTFAQGFFGSLTPPTTQGLASTSKHWLGLIWSSYLVIILMVISFWLGEREEYISLVKRHRIRTH